ncbi:MAG: lysylphosphatidylglycerol synthase transmembrane domain-containing protein [Rhodospirillales bacterium]|jgi:hypothetical protein|nr:lysylphosphatidylglycerol synthase transmembrane domain-containing protein [Rhodospirillales bacterium]MDP6774494.1 lysylphosphatidylglycerol synthase transmembrane domain-containing protein [Rhodospirillales bacterium]
MLKRWLSVALKFAVSGLLIWFLLGTIDLVAAQARLVEVAPAMLGLSLAVLVVQILISVVRWGAVLDALEASLPFMTALRLFMIGAFFNQTLPSSVGGDGVRMYMAHRAGLKLGAAINGVMLERAAVVAALVLVVLAAQPYLVSRVGDEVAAWLVPAALLFAAAIAAAIVFLSFLDRLPASLHRWRLVRGLAILAGDTRRVFLRPGHAFRVLGWSVLGHVNVTLCVYVLALGLKLDVTLMECLALFPPVLLVTTLPISIAGWGVREGAMVAAFGLVGVPSEGALVLSLLFGLVAMAVSLPGGLVWLRSGERRSNIPVPAVAEAAVEGEE